VRVSVCVCVREFVIKSVTKPVCKFLSQFVRVCLRLVLGDEKEGLDFFRHGIDIHHQELQSDRTITICVF
jgi:hypothetical protein